MRAAACRFARRLRRDAAVISFRLERRRSLAVLVAATEFREERDSHRSRSSGVTPLAVAISNITESQMIMRRRNLSRNCLDVRDRVQVKVVRKRLKLTDAQLADIIRKTGHSISAISKEAGARQQCLSLPKQTPPAAVIAAAEPEAAVSRQAEAV